MEADLKGQKLSKYKSYIEKRGAVIGESHSPYEVIRFKIYGVLQIIYKNKYGNLTFSGDEAERSFTMWRAGKNWTPPNRKRQQLSSRKLKIALRDGMNCFFCGKPYPNVQLLTIEHLLSFKHGGTDNINNLVLACGNDGNRCNEKLGHLAIAEKILLRDRWLTEVKVVINT